jgi:hypothetical protein
MSAFIVAVYPENKVQENIACVWAVGGGGACVGRKFVDSFRMHVALCMHVHWMFM